MLLFEQIGLPPMTHLFCMCIQCWWALLLNWIHETLYLLEESAEMLHACIINAWLLFNSEWRYVDRIQFHTLQSKHNGTYKVITYIYKWFTDVTHLNYGRVHICSFLLILNIIFNAATNIEFIPLCKLFSIIVLQQVQSLDLQTMLFVCLFVCFVRWVCKRGFLLLNNSGSWRWGLLIQTWIRIRCAQKPHL